MLKDGQCSADHKKKKKNTKQHKYLAMVHVRIHIVHLCNRKVFVINDHRVEGYLQEWNALDVMASGKRPHSSSNDLLPIT